MDPISSPELDSEAPPSGAPGQVVGPGGSVLPPQPVIAPHQALPPPSAGPAVTIVPTSTGVITPAGSIPTTDLPRPTAVSESLPTASSVILPPQMATYGAASYNETAAAAKTPFIKKLATKKMLLMAGMPLIVLGSSAAAYFGYIVPNQPDNIWAKALSNTGKGYDKLSDYSQKQISSSYKGIKVDGTFKISGLLVADGDFHGTSDGDNGQFTGNFSASGVKLSMDIRTIKSPAGSPDLYFKVDGLQGLANLLGGSASDYGSLVSNVNGNWYFVDHTFFEQYAKTANTSLNISQSDVKSVLDAVGSAGKQNIFTTDESKMAFVVKQKIGKEKQDGRSVYHFKVGVDKNNLKSYVTALCANLKNSSLKKFFNNDSQALDSALSCSSIEDSVNNVKSDKTADAWVDLRTKLIHKIRFTVSGNANNYFDISQDYQGGDSFPFSLSTYDKEASSTTNGSLNLTLNMKTGSLSLKGSLKSTGDNASEGSLDMTVVPTNDKTNVQKPAGAKDVFQLLSDAGLGDLFGGGSSSSITSGPAVDAERKTDINALHGQVEAYWAAKGYYPTLANLNDVKWVSANLVGLDPGALKDPAGSSGQIVSSPAVHIYAYQVLPAGCDNIKVQCQNYTLTATLSDGSTYVKKDLNDSSSSILN